MADRKGRSVTFKVPNIINLRDLRAAIEEETNSDIVVFQDLGSYEFLVELNAANGAEKLIEEGFDVGDSHVTCHPPHGQSTNVSIMGLRSYIPDDDVKEALTSYGEIKGEVIRLKYKADHELAGIENGNRLVKMVLTAKSIPYSIKIGGEWCRIIHNNQQPVSNECNELGHTRKRCPLIECRVCKQKGHMSYVCDQKEKDSNEESTTDTVQDAAGEGQSEPAASDSTRTETQGTDQTEKKDEKMDYDQAQGRKRPHTTDSDSDVKTPTRRSRMHPSPNIDNTRQRDKNTRKENLPKT